MRYVVDFKNVDGKRHENVYEKLIKELQDFMNESVFAKKVRFADMTWGYYLDEVIEIDEPKFLEELDLYFAPYEIEEFDAPNVDGVGGVGGVGVDGILTIDTTYMVMNILEAMLDNMKGE